MNDYFELDGSKRVTVSAYVRPALLLDPIDSKLATLQSLDEDDTIADLEVNMWPRKVPLHQETLHTDVFDTFQRFEEWTEMNGVTIRPPFMVETTSSELRDRTQSILRTPSMCLAISVDDKLVGVFPHTDGGTEYGLTEAIAALKTDELFTGGALTEMVSTAIHDSCPDCGGTLVNVQGVELCHDCAWNDWEDVAGVETSPPSVARFSE
jgi:hypothetical protein